MNFFCNKCQRRYSIADDKVRGKTVKVRCKNCQNVISVEGPPAEAEERTRIVSLENLELLREQDRSLSEVGPASSPPRAAAANTSWEDEPTRTMPLRDARSPWFAMVKNKQEGPLDEVALGELVASGAVTSRSYFWQQGMPDWKRAQDIPELAGLFAPAPPPPRALAPPPKPAPVQQSATSWQPEPPPPSQTTWQSASASHRQVPRASKAAASAAASDNANGAPLGELFSDLDLPQSEQQGELGPGLLAGSSREDPFAALGQEPGPKRASMENTQAIVKKAGVDRRNPPWKIALFVFLLLAMPVGVLYALTELQVVPLRVTRVDARGHQVQQPVSVFSSEGIGELRELMLGHIRPPPPAPKPEKAARPSEPVKQQPPKQEPPKQEPAPQESAKEELPKQEPAQEELPKQEPAKEATPPQGEAQKEAAALYAEGEKKDVGPEVRENTEVAATDSARQSGPPQEALDRVVKQSRPAFKSCIEQALRKNRRLRDGKLLLTATVGSSGTVKKVSFDRKDIDGSPMGECIKVRARRMVFPSFSGEDVEVEIPLVLTKSM